MHMVICLKMKSDGTLCHYVDFHKITGERRARVVCFSTQALASLFLSSKNLRPGDFEFVAYDISSFKNVMLDEEVFNAAGGARVK